MRGLAVLVMSWCALLALACGGGAPSNGRATEAATEAPQTVAPEATPDASGARPPDLTVSVDGSSVTAGVGTYCWSGGGRGVCVDSVGIVTPELALVGVGQPPLRVELLDLPLERATVTAWRLDREGVCAFPITGTLSCGGQRVRGGLLWPFESLRGEGRELPVRVEGGVLTARPALESGVYVVSLALVFQGGGDVTYGVLLVLLPTEG